MCKATNHYLRLFTPPIDSPKISGVDLIKLRYFRTVAKTLHFRRAAALLNVSQPPLSKSIKNLEDQLGTKLFVRSRRHVELTPAGQALLERCERIFKELEDAQIEVKRYAVGEKGALRIGCEDGTTFSVLPPLLKNFQKRYPAIRCSVVTQPVARQIVGLLSGDLDAGIVPLPMNHPELDVVKLHSCSMIAAFADRLPLAAKGSLRLRDLRHQPVVALPDEPDNLYSCILPYLEKEKISVKLVPGAFDISTLLLMAASGLGMALIPSSYRECGPPGLIYREIADATLDLSVGLAWKKGARNAVVANLVRVARVTVGICS
jgi:DNA-binding transcriptional LysR family regulator